MPRLISMAKTWPSIIDQTKLVTRRDRWWDFTNGAPALRYGEKLEATQWSLRVGPRWWCRRCYALGETKKSTNGESLPCEHYLGCYGPPQRGIFLRHVSSHREPLSAITLREVALEGFPGTNPGWFREMAFPGKPLDYRVTRIRFEYV